MKLFSLKGRVALVTGGNGGIGLGIAKGLAAAGAELVIAGRNAGKNRAALEELAAEGATAIAVEADVTQEADCLALMARTVERFGRLDILINNAGTTIRKPPETFTLAEWNGLLAANLTSAFLCSNAAYPKMVRAGGGKIIAIGSMMSLFGAPFAGPYAATKGGIVQMTKSLATAWAKDNIQANSILPGWIDTDLTVGAKQQVNGLQEKVLARTPAGRWGVPADLAGTAVFLASPASDFVTGTAIPVDGGFAAQA